MKLSVVILFVFGFRSTRYCCLNLPASLWLLHFGMFVAHLFAVFMLFPIKFSDCLSTPAFTCLLFYVLCSSFFIYFTFYATYSRCLEFQATSQYWTVASITCPHLDIVSQVSIVLSCIIFILNYFIHLPTFFFTSFYCLAPPSKSRRRCT